MHDSGYNIEQIKQQPNILAKYYAKFKVSEKYLLTGHSHQAWPDCSLEGQTEAWTKAATHVDDKCTDALEKAKLVQNGFSALLDDDSGFVALAPNTHDLLIRLLSSLDLRSKNKIITTDCEFHTVRRQLNILDEQNFIELVKVPGHPVEDVADQIIAKIDNKTSLVVISAVYFTSGQIAENLSAILGTTEKFGAKLLIDVYHALNIIPFSLKKQSIEQAYIIGGGYKYCQLGEGNAFLRFPKSCSLRPIISGWFSEWSALSDAAHDAPISYEDDGFRFAGSTYDPTSHYRAAIVFDFFAKHQLTPEFLRAISQHQIKLLIDCFDHIGAPPAIIARSCDIPIEKLAGFLVLKSPKAKEICSLLKERGVFVDYRNNYLRFGPAPYLADQQLTCAMEILKLIIKKWQNLWLREIQAAEI